MNTTTTWFSKKHESGQTLAWFALVIALVLVCLGLVVDLGFAYTTRAQLSKAIDAAALMAVRNLYQGQTAAANIARQTFAANYPLTGRDVSTPVPTVSFRTENNRTYISVSAATDMNTLFIRVFPQWRTLHVATSAEGMRGRLVMSLVLDRSGSMSGAMSDLRTAVTNFISFFDDNIDQVSMSSFSTLERVDVPMGNPFKQDIITAVLSMSASGGTYAQGGLTNALIQNATIPPTPGQDAIRVTVFFTDGYANMLRDSFNIPAATWFRYGGRYNGPSDENLGAYWYTDTGGSTSWYTNYFRAQAPPGGWLQTTAGNIARDEEYRCIQIANAMRQANTIVYAIGLGNNINQTFLKKIANTTDSPTFDPNYPAGLALFAPTSSQLSDAFRTIAANILPRLTQ
jgi:Flp pilus assembly protein TadG